MLSLALTLHRLDLKHPTLECKLSIKFDWVFKMHLVDLKFIFYLQSPSSVDCCPEVYF